MQPIKTFYKLQAETIIKGLNKRNMAGYYCDSKEDAVALAKDLIKDSKTVSFGGSMSLAESGMMDALKAMDGIDLLDRSTAKSPEEVGEIYRAAFSCDSYFMSTNAITLDGQLVNIDGNGNRVAALIFGPGQVIVIAGMNKVTPTLESAVDRVQNMASPPNTVRLNKNTPCAKTGVCHNCFSDDCICSNTVITRRSSAKDRIKVILVGEVLGY